MICNAFVAPFGHPIPITITSFQIVSRKKERKKAVDLLPREYNGKLERRNDVVCKHIDFSADTPATLVVQRCTEIIALNSKFNIGILSAGATYANKEKDALR